jgi:hypothetical protein
LHLLFGLLVEQLLRDVFAVLVELDELAGYAINDCSSQLRDVEQLLLFDQKVPNLLFELADVLLILAARAGVELLPRLLYLMLYESPLCDQV